ncbi:nuclease-related domain-containing protein [Sutcliffiella cohnii]
MLKLEAANRRIRDDHPKKQIIKEEFLMQQSGYRGEKTLDYYLSFLTNKQSIIIPNLRMLNSKQYFFEIDTLVMTPQYFILIESKNHSGDLIYDVKTNSLMRSREEQVDNYSDPILQVERQKLQFMEVLQSMKTPVIPLIPLAVFTNPYVSITVKPESYKLPRNFMKVEALPIKLSEINRMYNKNYIEFNQLKKIAKGLLKKDTPYDTDVLQKFSIKKEELICGVHCPVCKKLEMKKNKKGVWICHFCMHASKDAYKYSLNDFRLLVKPFISNRELRYFLNISSRYDATRMLSNLNASKSGKTKSTIYKLPQYDG